MMASGFWDIALFQGGYNTNIVLFSTIILGAAAGVVGSFIYLRGRALMSDAVSHATLPGIGVGFLVAFLLGMDAGRNLPALLCGAALTGILAAFAVQWIQQNTRLHQDVAIASVLGVFYGAGTVLLSVIQRLDGASQAGLDSFLLGQVTGINMFEAMVIGVLSVVVVLVCLCFLKELALLCFDREYAFAAGFSVKGLDFLLIALMLGIVCTGLKTVGLILILALLIIPPVAARFWCDNLAPLLLLSAVLGSVSCYAGAALSAYYSGLPTGGVIVLSAMAVFMVSMIFAPAHGLLVTRLIPWCRQ